MQSGTTARIRATFGSGCGVNEDWGRCGLKRLITHTSMLVSS